MDSTAKELFLGVKEDLYNAKRFMSGHPTKATRQGWQLTSCIPVITQEKVIACKYNLGS